MAAEGRDALPEQHKDRATNGWLVALTAVIGLLVVGGGTFAATMGGRGDGAPPPVAEGTPSEEDLRLFSPAYFAWLETHPKSECFHRLVPLVDYAIETGDVEQIAVDLGTEDPEFRVAFDPALQYLNEVTRVGRIAALATAYDSVAEGCKDLFGDPEQEWRSLHPSQPEHVRDEKPTEAPVDPAPQPAAGVDDVQGKSTQAGAAKTMFNAWIKGNRAAAQRVGTRQAVVQLFQGGRTWPGLSETAFDDCREGTEPADVDYDWLCTFGDAETSVEMYVDQRATNFVVTGRTRKYVVVGVGIFGSPPGEPPGD